MIRHLKILEYALSSLYRRKFKNLAIIAVYAFTIATLASIIFLTQALKVEAAKVLVEAPAMVVQRLAAGRHDLVPTTYGDAIRDMPGVGQVKPRVWGYYYDSINKTNYTLLGVDKGQDELELLEGRLPLTMDECAVGAGVAEAQIAGVGDDLLLIDAENMGRAYEITGIFRAASSLWTNDLIVFNTEEIRRFFKVPNGLATDLTVEVYNEREVGNLARKIKRLFPDTRPITRQEILHTYETVFNWRSGMILTIFVSALVAFCILAWDKATGISGEEKQEIGILKAIGWDTSDVLELKFWEGMVISLTAFIFGLLTAYIHVFVWGAPALAPVLKGWSVLFPSFELTPYVDLYQVVVLAFLTILPYVVSTVIPSWNTAITDPESVMRG